MVDFKKMGKELADGEHYVADNESGVRFQLSAGGEDMAPFILAVWRPDMSAMFCRVMMPDKEVGLQAAGIVEGYLNGVALGDDDVYEDEDGDHQVFGRAVTIYRRNMGGRHCRIVLYPASPGRQLTADVDVFHGNDETGKVWITGRFKGLDIAKQLISGLALHCAGSERDE